MKILTIVGARPQFIKAGAVSRAIRQRGSAGLEEVLVHTGQHFDENMSGAFFAELDIPEPKYRLGISGGSHGSMTGRMLEGIEKVIVEERPDSVLIYGDTNSTLAGALAAAKLHVPVAHVEAGLRSFNMRMPEEINRILADRVSTLLFCPTPVALTNLAREGITEGVELVGDVMFDVALHYRDLARSRSTALRDFGLEGQSFVLATCHRAENTDDLARLEGIARGLAAVARDMPVLLPLHPRTRQTASSAGILAAFGSVKLIEPLPYFDMMALLQFARTICTDSGGLQKEAYFFGKPCVTTRDETEWVELVETGWNTLVGADPARIRNAVLTAVPGRREVNLYGDGQAAERIASMLFARP